MARKRYEEEHDNPDRWMVSYADFITLLFAFFVVMYAISSVNEGKYRAVANSLVGAFKSTPVMPANDNAQQLDAPSIPKASQQRRNAEALRREREQMTHMARDIQKALAPLVSQGKVRVTQSPRGVRVEINASVLFAPGDARLSDETGDVLKAVASVLKSDDHAIQVEGHTDSVPIRNSAFPSNWELSSVRASSVVRLFAENGVAQNRLTAVGRGDTQPVDSNDTSEGRQRNRRVTVIILSSLPEHVTEVPLATGAER
ncbi:flagellar motor protein MotD [Noviherbaspirillum sp. UKPF54]|uniref:flagellar motor protein MotD n=1 Tax=Noviherbaspirillum sp. UKPF54 TaxID=2601898 RepID=UPI0011B0F70A|nr:flagellar motor protein MotD [Noviherbaspirillum sp. UKPF54]QDZ28133.1 flagellar motor protein MotD [Noviherbaspirillum sp. UKPF54]